MTARAIIGLCAYNLVLLGTGAGVLWGIRGWRWWTDLVRLTGLAYFLGVGSLMVLLTFELVVGIPVTAATILGSCVLLAASGIVVGRLRGHSRPRLHPSAWRFPGLSLFAALFVAGIVVYFEGLFRAGRLATAVTAWDSWAFWVPKAEGIYWFDRLSPGFLLSLPQLPSYPPGLSALEAGAFHALGAPDSVTLHLQYWFFAAGFVAAVAGLLSRRVHQAILYPALLLVLVAPSLVERMTSVYGDIPLAYLIALAALLLVLWLEEQQPWQLAVATIFLAGAMLTKREGILFTVCVLVAAFAATWAERRLRWKPLLVTGLVAFALALPWRIWFVAHALPGDGPDAGYLGAFHHLDRVWPSFHLVLTTLFDRDLWPIVSAVAVAAIVLAAVAGSWRISAYSAVFLGASLAMCTWAIWSNTDLPITQADEANPIVRVTSTPILVLAVLTPLLLERTWSARTTPASAEPAGTVLRDALVFRSRWAWVVVAVGLLSHPGAMLVGYSGSGLPGGLPHFPSASDCVSAPVAGERVRVTVGYADTYQEANALAGRARAAGLGAIRIGQDGCGRLRVFAAGMESAAALHMLAAAREAGLRPALESAEARR